MQVSIIKEFRCSSCKWPIIYSLCNDGMSDTDPYDGWDWWYYCSNKTCSNHDGEGVFQCHPEWVEKGDPR